jgi:hypothetical protein
MSSRAVSISKNNAAASPSAATKKMRATREARRLDVLHKVYTRSGEMSYVMLRRLMALIDAGCPKVEDEKSTQESDHADTPEQQPAAKTPVKSALKQAKTPNAPKKQQKVRIERALALELEPVVKQKARAGRPSKTEKESVKAASIVSAPAKRTRAAIAQAAAAAPAPCAKKTKRAARC